MSYPPLALWCYSGLFFVTPGRFHNEQKNSTQAGDTFGEWSYAPCPWFLGMDTGGSMALHKRLPCRRIWSGSTFWCAFQPTPLRGGEDSMNCTWTDTVFN